MNDEASADTVLDEGRENAVAMLDAIAQSISDGYLIASEPAHGF
ncbi:MAG: hypothetical protein WBE80_09380 [Methylocella sp.]